MAKIVLGKRPESFKRALKFPMVDGTEGQLEVEYKYRTLTEFGAFIDEWSKEQGAKVEAEQKDGKQLSNEEIRRAQTEVNADYIMQIVVGWNLDVEFTRENVLQLCDELPAAANEAINAYRAAITEGRLGN
jgi:hypothetical protein